MQFIFIIDFFGFGKQIFLQIACIALIYDGSLYVFVVGLTVPKHEDFGIDAIFLAAGIKVYLSS